MFNSKGCEIRKEDSDKLVVIAIRTSNDIYLLDRVKEEKYYVGKLDENWLCHRRVGHVNLKNLVMISKRRVVKNMPKITKTIDTSCKHCQLGKQTRVYFKTKENSTSRPLELIHTYLCGPIRTKGLNGETYFILFINDYSRMAWVSFLKESRKPFSYLKYSIRKLRMKMI